MRLKNCVALIITFFLFNSLSVFYINAEPINVSMIITNMDNSTLYAEYRTYLINHTFWDNETSIEKAIANITQNSDVRVSFQWLNDTDAHSIIDGSVVSRLYLINCSSSIVGNNYTIIWGFRLKHNAIEEKDIDLKGYIYDGVNNDTDTLQVDYADIITALVDYPVESSGNSGILIGLFILVPIIAILIGVNRRK